MLRGILSALGRRIKRARDAASERLTRRGPLLDRLGTSRLSRPLLLLIGAVFGAPAAGCSGGDPGGTPDAAVDAARDAVRDQPTDHPSELAEDAAREGAVEDATPAHPRLVTFNCHCLIDTPALRAKGIAAELAALGAHAVGLQEVCETPGSGDNFAGQLAAELGALTGKAWDYRFVKTHLAWDTYDEGLAILAPAGAIAESGHRALPPGGGFPRAVLWARLTAGGRELRFYVTHLTTSSWQDRAAQVNDLLVEVRAHGSALPQVVVGDFNDEDWTGPIQAMLAGPPRFTDTWAAKNPGQDGFTIGSADPTRRIDYIFAREDSVATVHQVELAFTSKYQSLWLSDHRGVFAELTFH